MAGNGYKNNEHILSKFMAQANVSICFNFNFKWKHDKVYTKSSVSNKIYSSLYIKELTNRWFYEDNDIIFGYIIS